MRGECSHNIYVRIQRKRKIYCKILLDSRGVLSIEKGKNWKIIKREKRHPTHTYLSREKAAQSSALNIIFLGSTRALNF